MPRLVIPVEILWIPVFFAPMVFFLQESQFLFCHNFFGMSSGNLSGWGLCRKLHWNQIKPSINIAGANIAASTTAAAAAAVSFATNFS
jgi:hypothetical protein